MNSKTDLAPVKAGLRAVEIVKSRFKRLPRGVIQIGAHNGREVPRLARSGVTRAVFIDPLEETFGQLEDRVSDIDGYRAIQALIGDDDGKSVTFNVSSNTGESSSFLEPKDHTKIKPDIHFDEQRPLTLRTLDSLLPEKGIAAEDYDMMFIDTQGAEKHVILGALNTLRSIDFIWMEVSIGDIYQGDMPISRFVVFLEALGFELGHCELKRLGWGDALFVRRSVFSNQPDTSE
ncbi:MAG: FkbM family methyltransferase [Roseovarius sp.]|jgi:FkbM family methyltransferase|nr:FkbM family methyltransferase [Roseovarius sp.]